MNDLAIKEAEYWNKSLVILQNELEQCSSDRSCVIVAATYLDDFLGYLFRHFLSSPSKEKEDSELFSGYGPLSTFSSKIILSYRLGLISDYEFKTLQVIRRIRNAFAHELTTESLDKFKDLLSSIVPPRRLLLIKSIPFASIKNDVELPLPEIPVVDLSSARDMFVKTVLSLTNLLSARCLCAVREQRRTPCNFESLTEIDDKRIDVMQKGLDDVDRIIGLTNKAIDLNKEILKKLSNPSLKENKAEIDKHNSEIEKLELELQEAYQEYIEIDAFISITKFMQERIKKAYDKESL